MTAPKSALSGIQKVLGKSPYQAHAGCCTWLNGVFWIRILATLPNGNLVIENLHDVGKIAIKKVEWVIEPDLVYPLLRGRDVHRWRAEPSAHIILAQDPKTRRGIPESVMVLKYPKTFSYFKQFEGDPKNPEHGALRGRSGYRKYFNPTDPFYSMYNVGPYTMSKWKVLWPEVGHSVRASVCGPTRGKESKPSLPDHTIIVIPCDTAKEAYYVAGMLNSSPAQIAVRSYIVLHPSPHILEHIHIPRFNPENRLHVHLAEISRQCHLNRGPEEMEEQIDRAAARIWRVNLAELRAIQEALSELSGGNPSGEDPDNPGDED
ncbi:MAG: hypothetical protein HUU16_20710 [Candidatus Omnitrophica bacterium]|nr:hypothetical protein [Candidatus Omnitrophota bacterium]